MMTDGGLTAFARYQLAKMYGRMAGWEADKLNEEQLGRKQQLCEQVIFPLKDLKRVCVLFYVTMRTWCIRTSMQWWIVMLVNG